MINRFLEDIPATKAAILEDLASRRLADTEEVADAVALLASASASYVNDHMLVVAGGSSLQLANTPFVDQSPEEGHVVVWLQTWTGLVHKEELKHVLASIKSDGACVSGDSI